MNMRRLVLLVGAIVLVAGVIGLLVPVSTAGPDNQKVGCGNAIAADYSEARNIDERNPVNLPVINELVPHTDYVEKCEAAVSQRRTWAIPVAIIGLVILVGGFFVGSRTSGARTG